MGMTKHLRIRQLLGEPCANKNLKAVTKSHSSAQSYMGGNWKKHTGCNSVLESNMDFVGLRQWIVQVLITRCLGPVFPCAISIRWTFINISVVNTPLLDPCCILLYISFLFWFLFWFERERKPSVFAESWDIYSSVILKGMLQE